MADTINVVGSVARDINLDTIAIVGIAIKYAVDLIISLIRKRGK